MRRGSRGNDPTFGYDPMGGYGIGTAPSPQAPPPMHAFAEPGAPSGPPIPEQGLPQGWTMEQWEHFVKNGLIVKLQIRALLSLLPIPMIL